MVYNCFLFLKTLTILSIKLYLRTEIDFTFGEQDQLLLFSVEWISSGYSAVLVNLFYVDLN